MTAIQEITSTDLKTETDMTASALTVKMTGSAETGVVTELDGFLKRLHQSAVATKVPEVVIDMRALEFMNSSCFKQFVSWINVLQESPAENHYKVRFIADENKRWQNRSLSALVCFAVDLIRIEN